MSGIVGQANTYNMPNFVGALFAATPEDTPFTSLIGGLTGGIEAVATIDTWQGYDLRPPGQNVALEGANAPSADARVRFPVQNVLEVHHEAIEVSYTKEAAVGQVSPQGVLLSQPVQNELGFQAMAKLAEVKRDIEYSFINGLGDGTLPNDNTVPRKMTGIVKATTTNVVSAGEQIAANATAQASADTITSAGHGLAVGDQVYIPAITAGAAGLTALSTYFVVAVTTDTFQVSATAGGAAIDITSDGTGLTLVKAGDYSTDLIDGLLQQVYDNGGISVSETAALMVGSFAKRSLTKTYKTEGNYRETSRTVAGMNLQTIETDFGELNLVLNRYMRPGTIQVVSLEQCTPAFLRIPGKGFLFMEPLAKVGSSDRYQLYGEVGLRYGNERAHGKVTGLKVA